MTVNAGEVSVRLAADFSPADFEKFDRAIAHADAKKQIEAKLGASFDPSGFTAYTKAVDRAVQRTERRGAFKAALGGEFDARAFNSYERELAKTRAMAEKGATTHLHAEVNAASFARGEREMARFEHRAHTSTGRVSRAFQEQAGSIKGSMLGIAGSLGLGYLSFEGAKDATKDVVKLAWATRGLMAITGMDARQASEWVQVAKSRGVEATKLGVAFGTLERNQVHAAAGSKTSIDAFKLLGLRITDVAHQKPDELMNRVSDALARQKNPAVAAAAAQGLLGRAGRTLLPLLKQGSTALDEQAKSVTRYGASLDKNGLKKAMEAAKAQREFTHATEGIKIAVGTALLPVLAKGAAFLSKFVLQMREGKGTGGQFATVARQIWKDVKAIVVPVLQAGAAIGKFASHHATLTKLAIAVGLAGAAVLKITRSVRAFKTEFALLNTAMKANPIIFISAAVLALGVALVSAYKHSRSFRDTVNGAFRTVEHVVGGVLDKLIGGLTTLMGAASTVLHVLSHVPGMGWAGELADKVDHLRNRLDRTRESMRGWGNDASSSFKQATDGLNHFIRFWGVAQAKHISVGGTRDLPHGTVHRAAGGPIPGFGGGDVIPAWLEPGEHVWTKGEVHRAGGHGAIHALRRALGGGGQAAGPGYAAGGMVAARVDVATGVEAERKRAQRPLAGIRDDLASIAQAAAHAGTATHQVLAARLGDARKAVAAQTGRLRKTAGDDFEGVRKDAEAKTRRTHDDTDDRWTDLRKRLGRTTEKWKTSTLGVFDDVRKSAGKTTSKLADTVVGNLDDARKGAVRRVTQLRDTVTDRLDDARKNAGRKTKQLSDTVIGRLEDARRGGSRRAGQLSAAVVGSAGDMERGTTRHLTAIRTVVADRMEDARRTGAMRGGQLRDAVAGSMGSLDTAVFRGMRYVGTATNEALKAFGAKPVNVSVQAPSKRAVGGWIGSPGEQGGDTELALLGRGEAVLNRHQQTHVDQALALSRAVGAGNFGSLDSLFGGVTTPHYFARGGRVPGYAQGGKAGGTRWDRLLAAANQVSARNFPYVLGGGHEQPARLEPMDCSGAVSYAVQHAGYKVPTAATPGIPAWGFPRGPGRVTIFDKRFGPEAHTFMRIGNRFWGTSGFARPGGGAGWFNQTPGGGYLAGFEQFHLPDLGADAGSYIPGAGGGPANIKTPKIKGRGPFATIARRALTRAAGAATSRIDKTWSAMNPGGGQALGDTGGIAGHTGQLWGDLKPYDHTYPRHIGGAGTRFPPGLVQRIADWAGMPPVAMQQIAHGESDWMPGVQQPDPGNGMVGYGLWQNTPHAWGGGASLARMNRLGGIPAMFNPIKNALMAKSLYDGGGLGPWYGTRYLTARGDRPHRRYPGGPKLPGFARGGFAGGLRRFASGGRARGRGPSASGTGHPGSSAKNVISGRIGTALKGLGGDWGMSAVTDRLGVLDADYAREDRAYSVDVGVQDFVVPAVLDASGKVTSEAHLDARALGRKAQSLDRLVAIRRQMMGVIKDARAALGGTLAVLKDAIGKLRAARAHAKSKDRPGYSRLMGRYVADIKGVQGARGALFTMAQDAGLDLREVKNERRALLPGAQSALDQATAAAGGGVDTGSAADTGFAVGDTGSVAGDTGGSMADVAAQAQQMFATFTQSRQDLFSQFGSNFTGAGGPGVDAGTAAAGGRYWGAFGPGAGGVEPPTAPSALPGADGGVRITNNYAAPPPDPHTHSVLMLHELQALGG